MNQNMKYKLLDQEMIKSLKYEIEFGEFWLDW